MWIVIFCLWTMHKTIFQTLSLKASKPKFVIAAFSPGALLSKTFHGFKQSCGESTTCYFRPLFKGEARKFLYHTRGVTVSNDLESEDILSEIEFEKMFFFSQGAPRYLKKLIKKSSKF